MTVKKFNELKAFIKNKFILSDTITDISDKNSLSNIKSNDANGKLDNYEKIFEEYEDKVSENESLKKSISQSYLSFETIIRSLIHISLSETLNNINISDCELIFTRYDRISLILVTPSENKKQIFKYNKSVLKFILDIIENKSDKIFVKKFESKFKSIQLKHDKFIIENIISVFSKNSDFIRYINEKINKFNESDLFINEIESQLLNENKYSVNMKILSEDPHLIDFIYGFENEANGVDTLRPWQTRDFLEDLADLRPAAPKRRSSVFLHNNYYHFNCLADGLRRRGWDALTVSIEPTDSPQRQFGHGEDLSLYDPDPAIMNAKITAFFRTVPERFESLHFSGMGYGTFFPELVENTARPVKISYDFFELRRHNITIGYMPSGCLDGAPQSAIREISGDICSRCVWELQPDICNNSRSLAWAQRLEWICDWIGLEGDWAAGGRVGPKYVRDPVVTALDARQWHPDLQVPDEMTVARAPGDILIYHAVGNYASRRHSDRDIKGTGAIMAAIDQLKSEGLPVQLFFATDIPSRDVRYFQIQADIVIDQLHYGRYGATARECMMLGKPVLVRLDPRQPEPLPPLRSIAEAPVANVDEASITDVLRQFVKDAAMRKTLGAKARRFALAWHGSDACAERYERVIDRLRNGLEPESADLFPGPISN